MFPSNGIDYKSPIMRVIQAFVTLRYANIRELPLCFTGLLCLA